MNFGDALMEMKAGNKVQRQGWNGKAMFIYYVDNLAYQIRDGVFRGQLRVCQPCIVMFTAQGLHQPGWLASQPDMLSEDWQVVMDNEEPRRKLDNEGDADGVRDIEAKNSGGIATQVHRDTTRSV